MDLGREDLVQGAAPSVAPSRSRNDSLGGIPLPGTVARVLELARVDFAPRHRAPASGRVVIATVLSVVGSLAIDAALVTIGTAAFPSTKGYGHFRFFDYATLTVIGVLIACVAWPIVTRITSTPRWLFFRMAIAVTLVLWLPDLYILVQGQSPDAVAVLMLMHVAIALVTYNVLVSVAPVRRVRRLRTSAERRRIA